jgi:hypothetical protein
VNIGLLCTTFFLHTFYVCFSTLHGGRQAACIRDRQLDLEIRGALALLLFETPVKGTQSFHTPTDQHDAVCNEGDRTNSAMKQEHIVHASSSASKYKLQSIKAVAQLVPALPVLSSIQPYTRSLQASYTTRNQA